MLKTDYISVQVKGGLINHLKAIGILKASEVDCPKCGSNKFTMNGKKADGRKVVKCSACKNPYTKNQYPKTITIPVSALPNNSKIPITRVCDTCKKEEEISWFSYMRASSNRKKTGLDNCKSCSNRKAQTKLDKTTRKRDRSNLEEQTWSKAVKEKDNYTCKCCGQVGGKLVSHHIVPWVKSEELRLDVNNGITLCTTCHDGYHNQTGGRKTLKYCNEQTLKEYILKKGMSILGMEWQNSTFGQKESAPEEGKHGEIIAATLESKVNNASDVDEPVTRIPAL